MGSTSDIQLELDEADAAACGVALAALESAATVPDAAVVDRLIDLLSASSKQVRRRAAGVLAMACRESAHRDRLSLALSGASGQQRWGAAFALSRAGVVDEPVTAVALEALGQDDADIRWAAAAIVRQAVSERPGLAASVCETAAAGTAQQRKMALYCLRDVGYSAPDVYTRALEDEEPGVRLAGLAGLAGCSNDDGVVSMGLAACRDHDSDAGVRRAAAATLERVMGDKQDLAARTCEPCKGGVPPLGEAEYRPLLEQLQGWEVVDAHHLARTFEFADFVSALAFVDAVGEIAEAEGHHPDLHLAWGKVVVETWTHKIDGLTESDFVLAAKIDRLADA